MALLQAVPLQNFELIRDRIAEILALELASQAALQSNPGIDAEVYTSRLPPFDQTDFPCVNVNLAKNDFPSKYSNKADGTYTYHIDIFTKAKSTDTEEGGKRSSELNQRIAGTIRAVLSDPSYRTLEFSAPSLSHTEVTRILYPEYLENEAVNYRMARVVFMVNTIEGVQFKTPTPFGEAVTKVKVNETDNGLQYIVEATP